MPPAKLRTVVHEHQFSAELQDLQPNFSRAESFIEGIEWIVARNPEAGIRVHIDPPIRGLYSRLGPGMKPVVVWYTYNAHCVYLLSIQKAQPDEPES